MIRVDGGSDSQSLIRVRGLNKTYSRGGEKIQVLQGLNLDVDKGDFVAFMGPSGSGKTTLLNLLGGLDVPSAGSITVDGDEITHMSGSKPGPYCLSKRRTPPTADQTLRLGTPQARGDRPRRRRSF